LGSIRDFQELMGRIYLRRDSKRGVERTMLWLVSEVGEFADALVKGDRKGMQDEAADVLAWLCSECNLLGINLEEATLRKYGGGCPLCSRIPCMCTDRP